MNLQTSESKNSYHTIENIKLDRKYTSFVSALKGAKVRIIRDEAFLKVKQLSGVLNDVIFKIKINENFTFTVEQTEGEVCSTEQITRIVKDIDSFKSNPYAEKYVIGELEFTDINGDLCYLEVEQLRPIDKLRSLLDESEKQPSLDVLKNVKNTDRLNSLIDSLFFDEEVSKEITNQGMKLTSELKNTIEDYFNNIDPDQLADDLVNNFGFEEVKEEVSNSYLMDSFNKMKQEQKNELQKRIEEKERELIRLSNELNTTNSKIKKAEEDLSNLNVRLKSFDDIELENGYSFVISQAINTPIDITENDEELLKKIASNFQMPFDTFKKYVTESSFKIFIKELKEDLDITKAYEKIYLIDSTAKYELIENNVILYKGKMKWHDLVDSMIRKGFKQDPLLDREIEEINKNMEIQEN